MPTINQLSAVDQINDGDQFPLYSPNAGDARKASFTTVKDSLADDFASLADLAAQTGAGLVGTSNGTTVQQALDARPTTSALAASSGGGLIGLVGGGTVAQALYDVVIFGSVPNDPSKAAANSAAWQAAFDRLPAAGGTVYLPNTGAHYLATNPSQPAGGATLIMPQGASWAGSGAPSVSRVIYENTKQDRDDIFSSGSPLSYETIGWLRNLTRYSEGGNYGQRLNYIVEGDHNDPVFDIADSVLGVWKNVNGGFSLARWDIAVGPRNDGGPAEGFAVYCREVNPQNQYGDEGYSRTRTTQQRWTGGDIIAPETQDFEGHGLGNLGYNILFGYMVGGSPFVNTLGVYAKTYNAFMTEADSIAASGVWGLAQGNTGAAGVDPKAALDIVYTWKMGIDFRDATFRDGTLGNNVAIRFDTEQMVTWRRISDSLNCLVLGNSFDRFFLNAVNTTEGVQIGGVNLGSTLARFYGADATPTDYIALVAGDGVADVRAEGSTTNVDLYVKPKGTGRVAFGTHTATGDTAISGYIEIKDAGGTVRKLAVIT